MERQRPRKRQRHRGVKETQGSDGWMQPTREVEHDSLIHATGNSNPPLHAVGAKDDFVRRWLAQTEREDEAARSRLSTVKYKHGTL